MKTLLYSTDYSENSIAAFKYAQGISSKMNAKLKVIHVFDYPSMLDDIDLKHEDPFPNMGAYASNKHKTLLNEFCAKHLDPHFKNLTLEVEAVENESIVHGITSMADEIKATMIIIGMKGGSRLKEILMGSTAKQLLKKAPCPVLAIPKQAAYKEIETIVYLTDFEEEDLGVIHKLIEIAEPFGAKIKVVHISQTKSNGKHDPQYKKKKIEDQVDYSNLEIELFKADIIFEGLKKYIKNERPDLIAVLEREDKSLSSQLFHRDIVKRMKFYGKTPLLSFNAKNYGIFHF
jgi:nucleotide-binding universal stress UspA family protein